MPTKSKVHTGIHDDILVWSKDLPDWQRDGLRRIVENGNLTPTDIDELTAACRASNGRSEESAPELEPLAAVHLPTGADASCKVTLCSVSDAENVNVIDSKQSLPFAPTGLTVIFGYNGSGKSGYGRVLRRACRARNKGGSILPNVLQDSASGPASAVITYAVNDVEQPPEQWIDGQRAGNLLGSVSFFDSDCASIHVRGKNDIAFTPFGLEVLPSLATGCKAVQEKLDSEKKRLEANSPQFLKSTYAIGSTKVGLMLRGLKASTSVENLELLASLSDAELLRLKEIPAQLAADPQKVAKELRTRAGRVEALRSTLVSAFKALSDEPITAIKALADDAATKTNAAQVAAQTNFADDPLPNIGEQVWRQLWDTARRYSAVSFPDREFPVIDGEDAVCLLCQQPLGDEAKDRLSRFEEFIRDDSAQHAAKAKEVLQNAVRKIEGLGLLGEALREQLKDVESSDKELLPSVRQQLATLIRRLRAIEQAHESGRWDFALPGTLENIDIKLSTLVSSINSQATEVEKSADHAERQRLEGELAELKAREWLATVLGDVKEHLDRLAQIDKLTKASKETRTNRITAKSKELAKEHVTDQLRDAFATEIKKMQQGVRRLNVELAATDGAFGSSYYRVQLVGASKADIGAVVSEGEHRCIALAGFLSELATEPCRSTVIFDDPVTSLDHHWRNCFAKRLVEEAADRQIIVFTHDIVFLYDLLSFAEEDSVGTHVLHLNAGKSNAGLVEDELPWDVKSVPDRIDKLEKEIREAKSLYDDLKNEEYKSRIESIYGRLRATVEKVVEEQLFCRVVVRHRDYINLKELRKASAIKDEHCCRVKALFDKCCDITDAHHRSPSRGYSVPTPADALADVTELKNIVTDVKAEQKLVT